MGADFVPMRPVGPEQVREARQTHWFRRGWVLVFVAYVVDGLVWWWSGFDLMYGFVVAATVVGTALESRSFTPGNRRVVLVVIMTSASVAAGILLSTRYGLGLPVRARLFQGAGGVAVGTFAAWLAMRRTASTRRGR